MDFTSLVTALLLALGLLGIDTVRHADVVELGVATTPSLTKSDRLTLDQATLEQEFEFELRRIAEIPSLVPTPLIHTQDEGIGMAVFTAINMRHVATALQTQLGYEADRIRLTLFIEQGELRGLIYGVDRRVGVFRTVLIAGQDEPLIEFVHRCSAWAASQLHPYVTALYELQAHADDRNFASSIVLIEHAMAALPPTPISLERSQFDNLLGLIALFRNDPREARELFAAAIVADPGNPAPQLNVAFTDIQLGNYAAAAKRMRALTEIASSHPRIIQGTAYMLWAAAQMGRGDFTTADALLAKTTTLNPSCASAFDLWGQAKNARGDPDAATELHRQALANTPRFQNYGEVAELYFQVPWQPGQALTRNRYANPTLVTFH